jgi:hypothetical protein
MSAGDGLRYEDLIRLKDILAAIYKANQELEQVTTALNGERQRAIAASAGDLTGAKETPSSDSTESSPKDVTAQAEHGAHGLEIENQRLARQVAQMEVQFRQEVRRRDEEILRLKGSAFDALRRGLVEMLQVLGREDPWAANAELRRQQGDLQRRLRECESQLAASRAELHRAQDELKRAEGSREALRTDCERMRQQVSTLPNRTRGDLFSALLNRLGVTQMAALLTAPEGESAEPLEDRAHQLLSRLANYLRDEGVVVTDVPGHLVHIASEADLARYRIPFDEQYHTGRARVTLPGIAYHDQVIIKASVRYVEEKQDEHRPEYESGAKDGPGHDPQGGRGGGSEPSREEATTGRTAAATTQGGDWTAGGTKQEGDVRAERADGDAAAKPKPAPDPEPAVGPSDVTPG